MRDVLTWFFVLELLGLIGVPLARRVFAPLPSRGYAFAKPLALLLLGYTFWLLGILQFLANSTGAIVFILLCLGAISAAIAWRDRVELRRYWLEQRSAIVASEVTFLVFFGLWCVYRAYNPDLNYTEKPMDLLFLNSLMRSPTFPPNDPWLSGYAISYYYFGYMLVSMVARLSNVAASVGFNLALATIMGLAASGAYSVGYDLIALKERLFRPGIAIQPPNLKLLLFPVLAALFVVFIGNFEGVVELANAHGVDAPALYGALNIKDLPATHQSSTWMPDDSWWWWRASRVLATKDIEVIDEFPYFSFIISDLHPHVMALPFALLAIALALATLARPGDVGSLSPVSLRQFWLYPVVFGALGFLNSWDFPTYTGLVILSFAIQRYRTVGLATRLWIDSLRFALFVGGLGLLAYLPFYLTFSSQASGIRMLDLFGVRTTFPQTIMFWGFFLFIVGSYLASQFQKIVVPFARDVRWMVFGAPAVIIISVSLLFQWGAAFVAAVTLTAILILLAQAINPRLPSETWAREATPTPAMGTRAGLGGAYASLPYDDSNAFTLVMLAVGFALVFIVEFVFIRDSFGSRMNTVFKFYYQAWILIALASAYVTYELSRRLPGGVATVWQTLCAVLLACVLVYPLAAFATQTNQLQGNPTLDGTAYMQRFHPGDAAGIAWLRQNAPSDAVVVEAVGGQYSEFGRVASQTGIPTLLGWGGHELQWRGNGDEAGRREPLVQKIYTSRSVDELRTLFNQFDVTYVFVGDLEKSKYGSAIPLTQLSSVAAKVFEQQGTTIYLVK